ncbi:MAG: TIGR04255 family protein, partial [Terriglobia bacterium]
PRYGSLRVELEKRISEFAEFLSDRQQEPLRPNAIEITYVNQVPLTGDFSILSDIVSIIQPAPVELGSPIETNLSVRFDVSEQLRRDSANLVVNVQRSSNVDPPLAILQLSCTSPVDGLADALKGLDQARYHVVQSFLSITTARSHEKWGSRDDRRCLDGHE